MLKQSLHPQCLRSQYLTDFTKGTDKIALSRASFLNQDGATAGLGNDGLFATLNQVDNLEAIDFFIQA